MALTPLPVAPSRQSPADFSSRMDDFLAALVVFSNELNALTAGESAAGLALNLANNASGKGAALVAWKAPFPQAVARDIDQVARDVKHIRHWGGDLKKALQDVSPYTTIVLDAATYDITGLFSNDFNSGAGPFVGNTKAGIRLQGAAMPRVNSAGTALTGGTIIQGTLLNLADDFEAFDLGIDCGSAVLTAKYGGAYAEGFVPGCNTSYPTPQATIKGFRCDRVISLGTAPVSGNSATYKHTVLLENLEGPVIGYLEGVGGYHVAAVKVVGGQIDCLVGRGGALGDAVIFKSDPANRCEDVRVGVCLIDSWTLNGVEQKAGCLRYEAIDGTNGHTTLKVKIGALVQRNVGSGIDGIQASGTYPIVDCAIGHLDANISGAAAVRLGYSSSDVRRFVVGTHNIISSGRTFELGAGFDGAIGSGCQTFTADAAQSLMTFDSAKYTHGCIRMQVDAAQSATWMIQRNAGDVQMDLITIGGTASIPSSRFLSSRGGSWSINATNAQDSGISGFASVGAVYVPYRVQLKGAVKMLTGGSAKQIGAVTPAPLKTMRFPVHSQTGGGSLITRTIEITAITGAVTVLDTAVAANDFIFLDSVSFDPLMQ